MHGIIYTVQIFALQTKIGECYMLIIKIAENELNYFKELKEEFPNNVIVKTEHGFDMNSSVQLVINIADILDVMLPAIIAAVEAVLLYRIQKRQTEISEKEVKLHKKEIDLEREKFLLEKAKNERNEFEIRISSKGDNEILLKTSDVLLLQSDPKQLSRVINDLKTTLECENAII